MDTNNIPVKKQVRQADSLSSKPFWQCSKAYSGGDWKNKGIKIKMENSKDIRWRESHNLSFADNVELFSDNAEEM